MKTLTIVKGYYGVSDNSVYYLDYNNGGQVPTFKRMGDTVSKEMVDRILYAAEQGYEIEVVDKTEEGGSK